MNRKSLSPSSYEFSNLILSARSSASFRTIQTHWIDVGFSVSAGLGGLLIRSPPSSIAPESIAQLNGATRTQAGSLCNVNAVASPLRVHGDVASCLLPFVPDTTQTRLLVRLKQPELPNAPQNTSEELKES